MRIVRETIAIIAFLSLTFPAAAQTPMDEDHVELFPGVIRVGEGIAYRQDDGSLAVAEPWFRLMPEADYPYQCLKSRLKVWLKGTLTADWPIQLRFRDKTIRAQLKGLYFYNPASDSLRLIAGVSRVEEPRLKNRGEKILFREVFPGADLLCEMNSYNFTRELILRDRAGLPGAEPGETYLGTVTELDLSKFQPYRIAVRTADGSTVRYSGSDRAGMKGGGLAEVTDHLAAAGKETDQRRIRFLSELNGAYQLCLTIEDEKAFVGTAEGKEKHVHPLRILKRVEGKDYLLELIPVSWLSRAQEMVCFRSAVTAGMHHNADEVFTGGNTYVVENLYQVKSLTCRGTAEKPVVVKFLPGYPGSIQFTRMGGKGAKVEHTIFTSIYDNHPARGAAVDPAAFGLERRPPAEGDYFCALDYVLGRESYLRDAQIYYAERGLTSRPDDPENRLAEMKNVLIENCREFGAGLGDWGEFVNNTIRNCDQAVVVKHPETGKVINSIFADNRKLACPALPADSFNNAFCGNGRDVDGNGLGQAALSEADGLVNTFAVGSRGDCYLNRSSPGGLKLIDSGYGTAESLGIPELKNMTTEPGAAEDLENLDRGFHYPGPEK